MTNDFMVYNIRRIFQVLILEFRFKEMGLKRIRFLRDGFCLKVTFEQYAGVFSMRVVFTF